MTEITIEKGKPIPQVSARKYPFDQMEVGDSFFVPVTENLDRFRHNLRCAARAFGLRRHQQFTVRTEDGGVRVWRTE